MVPCSRRTSSNRYNLFPVLEEEDDNLSHLATTAGRWGDGGTYALSRHSVFLDPYWDEDSESFLKEREEFCCYSEGSTTSGSDGDMTGSTTGGPAASGIIKNQMRYCPPPVQGGSEARSSVGSLGTKLDAGDQQESLAKLDLASARRSLQVLLTLKYAVTEFCGDLKSSGTQVACKLRASENFKIAQCMGAFSQDGFHVDSNSVEFSRAKCGQTAGCSFRLVPSSLSVEKSESRTTDGRNRTNALLEQTLLNNGQTSVSLVSDNDLQLFDGQAWSSRTGSSSVGGVRSTESRLRKWCCLQGVVVFRESSSGMYKLRICSLRLPVLTSVRSVYDNTAVWDLVSTLFKLPSPRAVPSLLGGAGSSGGRVGGFSALAGGLTSTLAEGMMQVSGSTSGKDFENRILAALARCGSREEDVFGGSLELCQREEDVTTTTSTSSGGRLSSGRRANDLMSPAATKSTNGSFGNNPLLSADATLYSLAPTVPGGTTGP